MRVSCALESAWGPHPFDPLPIRGRVTQSDSSGEAACDRVQTSPCTPRNSSMVTQRSRLRLGRDGRGLDGPESIAARDAPFSRPRRWRSLCGLAGRRNPRRSIATSRTTRCRIYCPCRRHLDVVATTVQAEGRADRCLPRTSRCGRAVGESGPGPAQPSVVIEAVWRQPWPPGRSPRWLRSGLELASASISSSWPHRTSSWPPSSPPS